MSQKSIVVTFGRFNPPHRGHAKVIDFVAQLANSKRAHACVFPSWKQDAKRNPLPFREKLSFLRRLFPRMNVAENARALHRAGAGRTLAHGLRRRNGLRRSGPSGRLPEVRKVCRASTHAQGFALPGLQGTAIYPVHWTRLRDVWGSQCRDGTQVLDMRRTGLCGRPSPEERDCAEALRRCCGAPSDWVMERDEDARTGSTRTIRRFL